MDPTSEQPGSRLPLVGVKVASFCWMAAGPLTVRYLGMWGATVVRIESHTRPDLVRLQGPYRDGEPGVDRNAWFPAVNSSSLSVSINIQSPKGKELAWRLIEWADVVASSFSPGQMEKWGFGYEDVRRVNPEVDLLPIQPAGRHRTQAHALRQRIRVRCHGGVHLYQWLA